MKKSLLSFLILLFAANIFAQLVKAPASVRNYSVKVPIQQTLESGYNQNASDFLQLDHSKVFYEEEIGQTVYDIATNISVDNRIFLYPDGTIGSTYILGTTSPSFPERGTKSPYFDGTVWSSDPPAGRIETVKTGWPSYSPLGNGEVFISHQFGVALIMCQRAVKGTGSWVQTSLPAVSGYAPGWPRICVNGNSIHVLSSANAAFQGQTNPLVYFRSQDGGATWNKQAVMIPGLTPADGFSYGFGADVYDWAQPINNTLAFVVGSKTTDLMLFKSTDDGETWTKTVIFQHPYPGWTDLVLTPDTPYVCDGAHAVSLDASGNAYVAFGLNRFLNDDTTDGSYSWFPGVDGLAIWKEGEPTLTSANPDDVYAQNRLIGWIQDLDGSGVVLDNYVTNSIASYQVSCTSQPQISIKPNGEIFVVYKSLVETMMSGGSQFYNHLYGRWCPDGNLDNFFLCNPIEITSGQDHDQVECVFPAMSKTMNGDIHLIYQSDFEPGTSIGSDADPASSNSIYYIKISENDFKCPEKVITPKTNWNVDVYPNPVTDKMNVQFNFNKAETVNMNIYNALGELVMNNTFVTERESAKQINLTNLSKGIYMVKFETEKGTFTKKFIKQ